MTDKVYRVAAIGCGRKGTEHARAYNLNPRSVVVAGADPDPENLAIFTDASTCPAMPTTTRCCARRTSTSFWPYCRSSPTARSSWTP